ncbi:hypothetical protein SAMN04490189_4457 [Pseudomonas koreensis]|nr:abortive infection protein [Pseudomonas koreensis]SDE14955.1 hypothetical protein SAMN04490189_4457 [Pseudomonas koreensis]
MMTTRQNLTRFCIKLEVAMIYSFGATNYFSFKEGMEISFELSAKTPKSISNGRKASTVLGVKGANASGKTNVLKAISFIAKFITDSFNYKEDEELGFKNFFTNEEPSNFFVDFELNSIRYSYELTATPKKVIREALYKKLQRKTLLVERRKNIIVKRVEELSSIDIVELKSNASLISTVLKYKLKTTDSDFQIIAKYFNNFSGNTTVHGVVPDEYVFDQGSVSEFYAENDDAFEFTKKIIRNSDLGIDDIVIHKYEAPTGKTEYLPIFRHKLNDGTVRHLTSYDQSSGTMALYRRLGIYWCMLYSGGVLIMDEFDQNCHPMLLPQIIELFEDPTVNIGGAQFLFTAHNSDIIDHLGKYRTILVGKDDGESFCYRLDQIPGDLIRNDRSIAALYREGKIGGIPRL